MKHLTNGLVLIFLLVGYVFNMYFLTTDKNTRDYQWVNKVGIIAAPLGSVMGYVYMMDKNITIKEIDWYNH